MQSSDEGLCSQHLPDTCFHLLVPNGCPDVSTLSRCSSSFHRADVCGLNAPLPCERASLLQDPLPFTVISLGSVCMHEREGGGNSRGPRSSPAFRSGLGDERLGCKRWGQKETGGTWFSLPAPPAPPGHSQQMFSVQALEPGELSSDNSSSALLHRRLRCSIRAKGAPKLCG